MCWGVWGGFGLGGVWVDLGFGWCLGLVFGFGVWVWCLGLVFGLLFGVGVFGVGCLGLGVWGWVFGVVWVFGGVWGWVGFSERPFSRSVAG